MTLERAACRGERRRIARDAICPTRDNPFDCCFRGHDGCTSLKLAREKQPDVPVIIISDTMGEEYAVECLHAACWSAWNPIEFSASMKSVRNRAFRRPLVAGLTGLVDVEHRASHPSGR